MHHHSNRQLRAAVPQLLSAVYSFHIVLLADDELTTRNGFRDPAAYQLYGLLVPVGLQARISDGVASSATAVVGRLVLSGSS